MSLQQISNSIKVISDVPENGMYFRDISGLLLNPELYDSAINMMVSMIRDERIDYVCGFESKGFIFGQSIAQKMNKGFVMLKKTNKPADCNQNLQTQCTEQTEQTDYKNSKLTIQKNLIPEGSYVIVVDDILNTGNSIIAANELIEKINCKMSSYVCLIELIGNQVIAKSTKSSDYKIFSLLKYPANSPNKFISKNDKLLFKSPVLYTPMNNFQTDDDRIIVFCHPSMREIADNIISFSKYFREGGVKWSYSSDNYPLITFENIKYITNKRIVFLGSLYNRTHFSEQLSLLTMLSKCIIKSLDVFIPYFAPGLHRSSFDNNAHTTNTFTTAESYGKIISKCLMGTKDGPPRIHIFDIHSEIVKSWFNDSAIVNLDTAITLLKNKVDRDTTIIVFPDQHIQDKYIDFFSDFKIYNVDTKKKINWPDINYIESNQNEMSIPNVFEKILIVDDWIHTGDTLEKCRLEVIKNGIVNHDDIKIEAYATHAVFTNSSYKNPIFNNFKKIYVTNSIPEITTKLKNICPFEILQLDGIIRDKLLQLSDIRPIKMIVPKQYNVYVASENHTKMSATYDAINHILKSCEKDDFNLKIYGVDVSANIPEQPLNQETYTGCQNRLNNLIKYVEFKKLECDFFVSIESGAYFKGELNSNTVVKDRCQVIMVAKSDNHTATCSNLSKDFTIFPAHFLIESIKYNQTITVGSLIEKAYGYKSDSWHERFGNKISRHQMIFNAIVESFETNNNKTN